MTLIMPDGKRHEWTIRSLEDGTVREPTEAEVSKWLADNPGWSRADHAAGEVMS